MNQKHPFNIELLPEHIIDQIKAGEVLERPAALLKELIENSIDAQSTEISIHLVENGLTLLSIEDNGTGIDFINLPKAFLRHATSKLKRFEDLYNLHSYGFRGEALASLAASARVTCVSQPSNLEISGGKLIINGGTTELLASQQINEQGTSLYIKDLFFNTPARLKFIKSKTSEKTQLKKIIYSFILSHPEIQFSIKWDENEKDFYKKNPAFHYDKRIKSLFPNNATLLTATESYQQYQVKIFFTQEASRNTSNKHQYLFVNARYFQDKSLHQTLIRNLESLWHYGESGHYVIMIDTPTDGVDVNVHPNKTQIKFLDSDVIYSLLVTAIKTALGPRKTLHTAPNTEHSTPLIANDISQFSSLHLAQMSSPSGYSQENFPQQNESSLVIIDQSFCFFQKNSNHYLVNLQLLTYEVVFSLIEKCLTNEDYISPLLVSEPFQVRNTAIDNSFDQMKKLGFEFDRLGPEVIILRTMPKNLPRALLGHTALAIIEYFTNRQTPFSSLSLESFFLKLEFSTPINFNNHLVTSLLTLNTTENNKSIVQLNKYNLGSFFK